MTNYYGFDAFQSENRRYEITPTRSLEFVTALDFQLAEERQRRRGRFSSPVDIDLVRFREPTDDLPRRGLTPDVSLFYLDHGCREYFAPEYFPSLFSLYGMKIGVRATRVKGTEIDDTEGTTAALFSLSRQGKRAIFRTFPCDGLTINPQVMYDLGEEFTRKKR